MAETVLLVEDEARLRNLIGALLEASGYRVLAADGPSQAIATANRHEGVIHLLLTDLQMPGMSGQDLATVVKGHRPDIRVLYMSKPLTQDALIRKVREALGPQPAQ